ncbi:MAG: ParB/RepB/Spo0J family partition protein [Clostridia bacterium]|nr:ParB/RepB/Spo0J family partition protein [Clostridia bacterium]
MFGSEKKTGGYPKTGQVVEIPIEDIIQSPDQPRQTFSYEKLLALSVSIAENGLLQPVTVCLQNGKPQLIAGERRLRAAKLAGMKRIPCLIADRTERDRAVLTLAENLQREALNPFEEAQAIARLIHVHGLSQEEVAYRLGYAQPTVANKLRLLRLPADQREKMLAAGLTERHARALLRIEEPALRETLLNKVIRDKMTVAGTERMVEATLTGRRRKLPPPVLRDVRVFSNTIEKALQGMQQAGVRAYSEKNETEEYVEYRVRILKKPDRQAAGT